MIKLNNFLNWFVPQKFAENHERIIKSKLIAANGFLWGFFAGTMIETILYFQGDKTGFFLVLIAVIVLLTTPFFMKYTGYLALSSHIIIFSFGAALITWAFIHGEMQAYINILLSTLIILSILIIDINAGLIWTVIIISSYIYLYFNLHFHHNAARMHNKEELIILFISTGSAAVIYCLASVYIVIQKDILKRLDNAMNKLKSTTNQLVQSEKQSSACDLTAGISHEFSQPLNVIKLTTQLLKKNLQKYSKEELNQKFNNITHEVDFMADILDHMKIFSRESLLMKKEKLDINYTINSALKFFTQQLKDENINLAFEKSKLPPVIGDSQQLEQVIINFITNARKSLINSSKPDPTLKIKTYFQIQESSEIEKNRVVIHIEDNGYGIPGHIANKIFDPFFTTSEPGKGIGLGLSLANKIIEDHGGRIILNNHPGTGIVFLILLPGVTND